MNLPTTPTPLLPCPFCGNPPSYRLREQGPEAHGPGAYWPEMVYCRDCHITFRKGERGVDDPKAKWNGQQAVDLLRQVRDGWVKSEDVVTPMWAANDFLKKLGQS